MNMKKTTVIVMAMVVSQMAFAADLYCSGKLLKIQINKVNEVFISPDWHTAATVEICKLDGTWKSVPAAICEQWVASLQSAMYLNKTVGVKYVSTAAANCAAMPDWGGADAPYLIEFLK